MEQLNILVTGDEGFIGSHLVDASIVRQHPSRRANISRARAQLGYEPRVTLEQGIPELIAWVKEQQAETDSKKATAELEQRQLVR